MTNAEKALQIKEWEDAQEEKRMNLSKGDRLHYDKMQAVLREQMGRITDDSAITIHGLNSELKMIRKQLQTFEESKTPPNPAEIEALKTREQEIYEIIHKIMKQT